MNIENKKYLGRVYCIRSPSTEQIYIGSTINILSKRMAVHRAIFQYYIGSGDEKRWCQSFYILNYLDAYIELLSEHNNISKDELRRLEGEAIRANKNICVNKCIAGQTHKEWRNSPRGKEKEKKYEQSEKGKEAHKRYRKSEKNKEVQKRYREKKKIENK
jgi:hypothetical protein